MSPKSEYKGRHILDYKKDTEVVVNIGGEWKKARVKNDAVLNGKKLKMERKKSIFKNSLFFRLHC